MNQLREEVTKAHEIQKKKEMEEGPKAAFGYGGKFGVQSDRYQYYSVFNKLILTNTYIVHNMFVLCWLEWINQPLDMIMFHPNSSTLHRLTTVLVLVANLVFSLIELTRFVYLMRNK